MEFLRNIERFIRKGGRKELPLNLQGELRSFPNPIEETAEEKNLREISIIESSKRGLEGYADFYETKDCKGGVFKEGKRGSIRSERAAYLVDKFLGFDLVPTTVIKTIEGKEGSFQRFIPDARTGLELSNASIPRDGLHPCIGYD